MEYWKVVWHHEFPDEPVEIYNEIGEDGYERRKVERFRDGSNTWADVNMRQGGSVLSEIPVGDIDDVREEPDFSAWTISKDEFERIWEER